MIEWDYSLPWYHGTQQELTILRAGSSISQNCMIARIFSHRPALVSKQDDETYKHNGTVPGYLYLIDEKIGAMELEPHLHPVNIDYWEWLTKRDLKVRLLTQTIVDVAEQLTEEELAELRRRQIVAGTDTFTA